MTPTPADPSANAAAVDVTQADRDAAADIWRDYIGRIGEIMVERGLRSGTLDNGLPSILARHRLATPAPSPAPGLADELIDAINALPVNDPSARNIRKIAKRIAALRQPDAVDAMRERCAKCAEITAPGDSEAYSRQAAWGYAQARDAIAAAIRALKPSEVR